MERAVNCASNDERFMDIKTFNVRLLKFYSLTAALSCRGSSQDQKAKRSRECVTIKVVKEIITLTCVKLSCFVTHLCALPINNPIRAHKKHDSIPI